MILTTPSARRKFPCRPDAGVSSLDLLTMKWLRRLPEAPVTSALLVANLAVWVAMVLMSRRLISFDGQTLIDAGANLAGTRQDVSHWRWLTAAFIHVSLLHIAMNMWVLIQIGVLSERTIGGGVLAAAYVLTGVAGNMASTIYNDWRQRELTSAGASGAIMGLIGIAASFAWRTGQRGIARSLLMNVGFVLVLGIGLNLDNAAHIGGFVIGALIGLARARWPAPLPRWLSGVLIGIAAALSAAAFVEVCLHPMERLD
jgi:rhomboid protease GluP